MTVACGMKTKGTVVAALLLLPLLLQAADTEVRVRMSEKLFDDTSRTEDVKAEIDFGRSVAARILGRHLPDETEALTRYVNLVGNSVAMSGPRPEISYRVVVLDTDEINAYAAPGGYIFITRGALAMMEDEAELAAVLAHEVAHVTERHIVRELNIHGSDSSPTAGFARFLGGAGDPTRIAFTQAVDKAVSILFEKGLKRQDEFDADRVGTLLLAQTGYDATALRRYLVRVKAVTGEQAAVLHRTHPPFGQRIERLDTLIRAQGLDQVDYPKVGWRFGEIAAQSR